MHAASTRVGQAEAAKVPDTGTAVDHSQPGVPRNGAGRTVTPGMREVRMRGVGSLGVAQGADTAFSSPGAKRTLAMAGHRQGQGAVSTLATKGDSAYSVPPTVRPSMRRVGCPTPTGTLWPSLPQVPTPGSSWRSLPIMETRVSTSGPLPIRVAPFTG